MSHICHSSCVQDGSDVPLRPISGEYDVYFVFKSARPVGLKSICLNMVMRLKPVLLLNVSEEHFPQRTEALTKIV